MIPLIILHISIIADKYLSVSMNKLSETFKLSYAISAITLIAFANGSVDIITA